MTDRRKQTVQKEIISKNVSHSLKLVSPIAEYHRLDNPRPSRGSDYSSRHGRVKTHDKSQNQVNGVNLIRFLSIVSCHFFVSEIEMHPDTLIAQWDETRFLNDPVNGVIGDLHSGCRYITRGRTSKGRWGDPKRPVT